MVKLQFIAILCTFFVCFAKFFSFLFPVFLELAKSQRLSKKFFTHPKLLPVNNCKSFRMYTDCAFLSLPVVIGYFRFLDFNMRESLKKLEISGAPLRISRPPGPSPWLWGFQGLPYFTLNKLPLSSFRGILMAMSPFHILQRSAFSRSKTNVATLSLSVFESVLWRVATFTCLLLRGMVFFLD